MAAVAAEAAVRYDLRPLRADFPGAPAPDQRPSARLPRQCRLVAAADRRDRGGRRTTRARTMRTSIAACTRCRRKRPRCTRARASACATSSAPRRWRDRVRARHDRGDQPRRAVATGARGCSRATRSSSRGSSTTRTSCPGRSSPRRRARCVVPVPIDRRGVGRLRCLPAGCSARARASSRSPTSRTRSARCCRSREFLAAARERGITTVVDGAQAVPHLHRRRAGARLRLLRVLRAQDVRPDRHRRALRARGRAGGDAALAGRRRHDPHRVLRGLDLEPPAAPLRGGHAEHRRRGRARRRDRLPRSRSASTRIAGTSTRCSTTRPPRSRASPGLRADRHRRRQDAAWFRSPSRACIRTTSARCSIRAASPCAPAITARCR